MSNRRFLQVAAFVAAAVIVFSVVAMSVAWAVLIAAWFACLAVQHVERFGGVAVLDAMPSIRRFHRVASLSFPAAASALKWHEALSGATESTGLSNRLQHGGWALCTVGLFAPTLLRWTSSRRRFEVLVIVVGFVALLGNLNEVMEFKEHVMVGRDAYSDTIKDLTMNVLGASIGAMVLNRFRRTRADGAAAGLGGRGSAGLSRSLPAPAPRRRGGTRRRRT